MKYPNKLFLILPKTKKICDETIEIAIFLQGLKTLDVGINPNDKRSQIKYKVEDVKFYPEMIEINLERATL